jgi:hypothetical protein
MPCSLCGENGHNRRTCHMNLPNDQNVQNKKDIPNEELYPYDNIYETIILMERCLREFIINDKVKDIDDEQLKLYENMLDTKKIETKLINLEQRPLYIYIVEGNSNFLDFNQSYNIRYLGQLFPRSMMPITTFTGYRYIIVDGSRMRPSSLYYISDISRNVDGNKNVCNLDITKNIQDTINLNINDKDFLTFKELNTKNRTLFSLLKNNYLIEQLIRLGAKDNPNFEAILDLHQDIELPKIEPIDLEGAGIPNEYTNMN